MKTWLRLALVLLLGAAIAGPVRSDEKKEEKPKKETYSATAFGTAGVPAGKTLSLTIYVDSYTTDQELHELAQTLKTGGSDAVLKAMDKIKPKKGRVAPTGRTGNEVAIIRTRKLEDGRRRIMLITDRPLSFAELRHGTRSRDYEFGVIELLLDAKGKGEGTALAAAKIFFNKQGELEIEHYGIAPIRLANVYMF